ncbi:MAG TPA: SurA N-terminal domain-containing protein [Nitrospirota bacterium]|nr:SurA N-terminal domain-containing protein [Nitrospirota bacterium]
MIEFIRKHMGWMMWIIVGLVTVTFLFFGIYPSSQGTGAVAKVGDTVITSEELNVAYRNLYENYRELLKGQLNENLTKGLRNQALQELIVNRLLVTEAEREGIRVTNEELQGTIMMMPAFMQNGRFNKQIYERTLDRINMSPALFEAGQREYLMRLKLERLVKDSVAVGDAELVAAYMKRNPNAKPGDFEKNREGFRQSYLAEKQRDALTAYIRSIQTRIPVKIEDKALKS